MAGLTPKQAAFVREYLVDLNATQAAVRAGYSKKTAEVQGCRLLRNAQVARAVEKQSSKAASKAEITIDWVLSGIREIGDKKRVENATRLKAFELGGKYLKLFTEKHQVEHSFPGMTDEQLEAKKRELVAKALAEGSPA